MSELTAVAIVGGGPVGLFCAAALARQGIAATVLEREPAPTPHTRSIGIHPPSLERLAALGLADAFVRRGVPIRRASAFAPRGRLGTVDFAVASRRFPFVLALPQPDTEALLADAVRAGPGRLVRGAVVTAVRADADAATVWYRAGAREHRLRARWVLACDGHTSMVRGALGIAFDGEDYPGSYLMADLPDDGLGEEAAVFLADDGLVESFPLPHGRRRWVTQAPGSRQGADAAMLCSLVTARTGHQPSPEHADNVSAFGVQQRLAARFRHGPVALLGDAAHVVSPFGGQGMNLGWLDAWALARALPRGEPAVAQWARHRRRVARAALRRGAFNTRIGRRPRHPRLRNTLIRAALTAPLRPYLVRRFAMADLG